MIKRTIEISQQPVHLTVRNQQLLLLPRQDDADRKPRRSEAAPPDQNRERERAADAATPPGLRRTAAKPPAPLASIPCEDIGVVLVEHAGTTYSHAALETLLRHGAALVICGRDHLPAGILLPIGEHTQVVPRLHQQIALRKPLRKQLWRQIVQAKIRAQAANLEPGSTTHSRLLALARNVRSGDPTNVEAQAARSYWQVWLEGWHGRVGRESATGGSHGRVGRESATDFRRDPAGPPPNNLLNYGYAVLRAASARAVVAAGLTPALGIHHHQRSDAFCLADDLVEPLRPLVDDRVRELHRSDHADLTPPTKAALLELLTVRVQTGAESGPLMVALHRYVASLVRCYEGSEKRLLIPLPELDEC